LTTFTSDAQFTVIFTGPDVLLLAIVSPMALTVTVLLMNGQLPLVVSALKVIVLFAP
jgi:hypothetical protein